MNGNSCLVRTTGVATRKGRLMKLLYTDMSQDLTEILTEQATSYAQKGKRVFYIAPNALSFEKERKVLEYLPKSVSFDITVTRFTQMPRYFILNTSNPKTQLDDTGLAMIFYKVLSHMDDDELKVYGRLRKDSNFINQLVDLYKELQQANMTVLDLQQMCIRDRVLLVPILLVWERVSLDKSLAILSLSPGLRWWNVVSSL